MINTVGIKKHLDIIVPQGTKLQSYYPMWAWNSDKTQQLTIEQPNLVITAKEDTKLTVLFSQLEKRIETLFSVVDAEMRDIVIEDLDFDPSTETLLFKHGT